MVFAMDRLELDFIDVSVNLRRGYVGMAEQLLNDAQIGSAGEQVCREAMAERVR